MTQFQNRRIIAILSVFILSMLGACARKSSLPPQSDVNPPSDTKVGAQSPPKDWDKIQADADAKVRSKPEVKDLLSHFIVKTDKITKKTIYRHKNFSPYIDANGTGIQAEIQGHQLFLRSSLLSQDFIYQTRIMVRIGDQLREFSGHQQREVISSDRVVEVLNINYGNSRELAPYIEKSSLKDDVLVRFEGTRGYKDCVLSKKQRIGIAETCKLWELLGPL